MLISLFRSISDILVEVVCKFYLPKRHGTDLIMTKSFVSAFPVKTIRNRVKMVGNFTQVAAISLGQLFAFNNLLAKGDL